jgi:hypothetical protein
MLLFKLFGSLFMIALLIKGIEMKYMTYAYATQTARSK